MRRHVLIASTALLTLASHNAEALETPATPATPTVTTLTKQALTHASEGERKASEVAYRRILKLEPDHRLARRALGYVRFDGAWITQAAAKQAIRNQVKTVAAAIPATPTPTPVASRPVRQSDPEARARRLAQLLAKGSKAIRMAAAEELGRLGSTLAAHYLIKRLELTSGPGPHAYFSTFRQKSYIHDYDVEVA